MMHASAGSKNLLASRAIQEALSDFRQPKKTTPVTIDDEEIIPSEADDEMSDDGEDEQSNAAAAVVVQKKKLERMERRAKKIQEMEREEEEEAAKRRINFSSESGMDAEKKESAALLPWWAQERQVHDDLVEPAGTKNLASEWKENLMMYDNLGSRINIVLVTGLVSVVHSTWYYPYLPDQVQICLRETNFDWWCEVDEGAIKLIAEFAKGKEQHPMEAFPISNKMKMVSTSVVSTLCMNVVLVGIMQFLPWILSKKALPPPSNVPKDEVDSRRIALLSMFGYWLGWIGWTLNIFVVAANHTKFRGILITYEASIASDGAYDNTGRGTDERELLVHYLFFILSFFYATFLLINRIYQIHLKNFQHITQEEMAASLKRIEEKRRKGSMKNFKMD